MRSALLLVLLLAAPLSLVHDQAPLELKGEEVQLTLPNDEQWTQTAWDNAIQSGYVPLRIVSPTELIAWKLDQTAQTFHGLETVNEPAPWQSIPSNGQSVTVVFEPNLPEYIQHMVIERIAKRIDIAFVHHAHDAVLPHVTIEWNEQYSTKWFSEIDGVLWFEPALETVSRNLGSALQLSTQNSDYESPLAWELGLNGSGVVVGIADSGIDADHSCFRNLTSDSTGDSQRKLLHINTSIDEWDSQGHSDYRHGTHTAGSVGCHPVSTAEEYQIPSAAMALGYGTKLVVQDIVSEEGWLPPDVDYLLLESSEFGAVLHSDSWGDDTTEYTLRSGDFDAFTREYPWSLPLIAPGNNGGDVLEPANARNVIAIGASTKDDDPRRWNSSVHGPTEAGTRGVFALAPGVSITSARSDGQNNTWNSGHHTLSGTSMSTPTAAGFASIIEQMVRDGWFTGHNESLEIVDSRSLQPWFSNTPSFQHDLLLGEGFTPSAPLLKSLLALSTTPLSEEFRNGGMGGGSSPNSYDG
ncbi:MAG: S8 family serine peptidase, partial [Candidatus Poseidoniaceae archaeon]|nr:S8 family serine peptidase [Candidatus Poseidoniaceae archaeon]